MADAHVDSQYVTYLLTLRNCCDPPVLAGTREEKIAAMQSYAQGLIGKAKERLTLYPQIEIVNDKLLLGPTIVAQSKKIDFEDIFNVELRREGADWTSNDPNIPTALEDIIAAVTLNRTYSFLS